MSEPVNPLVKRDTRDGVLVLTLTAAEVRSDDVVEGVAQELLAALGPTPPPRVVLDLTAVQYLGSLGFRPLLSLRRKLAETGGRMVLCGLSPEVANVFRVSRLMSERGGPPAPFQVETDVAAAVAHLNRTESGA